MISLLFRFCFWKCYITGRTNNMPFFFFLALIWAFLVRFFSLLGLKLRVVFLTGLAFVVLSFFPYQMRLLFTGTRHLANSLESFCPLSKAKWRNKGWDKGGRNNLCSLSALNCLPEEIKKIALSQCSSTLPQLPWHNKLFGAHPMPLGTSGQLYSTLLVSADNNKMRELRRNSICGYAQSRRKTKGLSWALPISSWLAS